MKKLLSAGPFTTGRSIKSTNRVTMMKPVRYEMLGAPTLLYRHHDDNSSSNSAPSSSQKRHIIIHQPTTTTKSPHQRLFHPDTLTPQQIYMKEYLEVDPFKKWFSRHDDNDDNGGGKKKGAPQPRRKRLREDEILPLVAASGSMKRTSKRLKPNNDYNNNVATENSDSSDEDEKKREVGGSVGGKKGSEEKKRLALKYYTFDFDNDDVPDEYIIAKCATTATSTAAAESNLEKRTLKEEFNDEIDDDIIKTGEATTEETTTTTTATGWNNEVGGSLGYGNCLVAITCTCQCCCSTASSSSASAAAAAAAAAANVDDGTDDKSDDATTSTNPSSFLVHPVGERLSSVTIDKLIMPRDNVDYGTPQSKSSSSSRSSKSKSNTIDVGGTILQIAICGMGVPNNVKRMNQEEDCQSECLVVRTSRYCVVILAKSRSKNDCEGKASVSNNNNNDDDDESDTASLSSIERERRCSTTFELMELSRIDLCTSSTQSSYLPVYVACDPKVVFSSFANPSFAILSRSNQDQTISGDIDCTTIHEVVQVGEESSVTMHTIPSLANISLIEYHASEMSVFWAAARATNVPKPYNKDKDDDSGVLRGGYGHSLFKINLRNDSASHVWSPSKAEYSAEGVHSINGIMNDLRYKHIVWVSSSSACKVWALDVRHNAANVVMCFSLAQLSDDFGPELGVAGIYGAGMIMTQPPSMHKCTEEDDCSDGSSDQQQQLQYIPPTMFGVKKDPNAYSLHAYQLPTTLPRFQTMPLEGCSFVEAPVAKYSTSCIARSTIYPLPICSDKTFRVGLATLRCSSNSALRKVDWKDTLAYDEAPDIIYALTMISAGDIHCHALLECDSRREVQARCMEGMPVGAAAISVPVGKRDDKAADKGLRILLSNDFPLPFNDVALF
jgi:hypothetical protein